MEKRKMQENGSRTVAHYGSFGTYSLLRRARTGKPSLNTSGILPVNTKHPPHKTQTKIDPRRVYLLARVFYFI